MTFSSWLAAGPLRARSVLLLGALIAAPLSASSGADPGVIFSTAMADTVEPVEDRVEADEEDETEDKLDDGSSSLPGTAPQYLPSGLRPVGPAEERSLLGDWGDSAGEAED